MVGALIFYLTLNYLLNQVLTFTGIFLAAWMGLFPDIVDRLTNKHRGLGHSLLWLIPLTFTSIIHIQFSLALIIGFLSHLILDVFTTYGCPLLYPLRKFDFACLKRKNRIQTGTNTEKSVFIFLIFLLIPMLLMGTPLLHLIPIEGMATVLDSNPDHQQNNSSEPLNLNLNLRVDDAQHRNITLKQVDQNTVQVLILPLDEE